MRTTQKVQGSSDRHDVALFETLTPTASFVSMHSHDMYSARYLHADSRSDDSDAFYSPCSSHQHPCHCSLFTIADLERTAERLREERDRAQAAFQRAEIEIARTRASRAYERNKMASPISKLPNELLLRIFTYVQNSVVISLVCSHWRAVALASPRLWSSLHIHPSKGPEYLCNLLLRSVKQPIEICFCPLPSLTSTQQPPTSVGPSQLSWPPSASPQYHNELILTPRVVNTLLPHVNRFRSFEIHAVVPGTWRTLLPVIQSEAPVLRHLHIFTSLPQDVAHLQLFGGFTPKLQSFQMTGAFPAAFPGILSNLSLLRLESIPFQYRPTTLQISNVLRACPNLVSLSLLDAGPIPDLHYATGQATGWILPPVLLHKLQALAFRETDSSVAEGSAWFFSNVHAPNLLSLHMMQVPGRVVARVIPPLLYLEELYLWAPHAPSQDIISLLWKLPALKTLELPMVKGPIDVLHMLSNAQIIREGELYNSNPPGTTHVSFRLGNTGSGLEHVWLCPKLERIGIPYVTASDGHALGEALKRLFIRRQRNNGVEGRTLDKSLNCVMAPGGRPEYISQDVWTWLGQQAMIRTLANGMDMLFDSIPLWNEQLSG